MFRLLFLFLFVSEFEICLLSNLRTRAYARAQPAQETGTLSILENKIRSWKNCSNSEIVQIQTFFKFRNCSNPKFVQIRNMCKLKNCSNSEIVQIQKLIKLEICSDLKVVQILNLFKYKSLNLFKYKIC
jgi:hypothetical protein